MSAKTQAISSRGSDDRQGELIAKKMTACGKESGTKSSSPQESKLVIHKDFNAVIDNAE